MTDIAGAAAPGAPAPGGLVVVSNRLPFEIRWVSGEAQFRRSPGGLVTALDAVLSEQGGVWVGWPGVEHEPGEVLPVPPSAPRVTYRPVALTAREVTHYYGGFANGTLWPLFHYFIARTRIDAASWRAYARVNGRFAAEAVAASTSGSLVWVHDYQLMLVPELVRRRAPDRRIAFFLHIPFPAADVFRILPWSRVLLRGLLGADLVGFHVPEYAEHFLTCAERLLGCEVDHAAGRVYHEGRTVSVEAHPISIDGAQQERLAQQAPAPVPGEIAEIVGVDRLDYTKGILERLQAVERLLERHPEYRGRVVYTQLMVPSRLRVDEYQAIKREIDETVGRVNGRFSDRGWAPVRYLVHPLGPEDLAALYRSAAVALVTPLRDGMNLVAKEYVASQVEEQGVLVLSETAGAAAELPEALIVNPYDIDAVADSLHRALEMPAAERRARMSALRHRVRANDVWGWLRRFLDAADAASRRRLRSESPADALRRRLEPWLAARTSLTLFLDYDGTLAPIVDRPEDAHLGEEARRALEQAVRAPDLDTVIVSGRALSDVRAFVGIEGLTYVGDHGFEMEGPGLTYTHPGAERFAQAMARAADELASLPFEGALVQRKRATVAYHVRSVAEARRPMAVRAAEKVLRRHRLAVLVGRSVVEALPPLAWDKGQAVLHLLRQRVGEDWSSRVAALYAGDDTTDELAFRSLRGIGRSIRIGPAEGGVSAADYSLPGPDDLVQLVRWLATGAFRRARH